MKPTGFPDNLVSQNGIRGKLAVIPRVAILLVCIADVLAGSHQLQVIRADTEPHVTQMADQFAVGDSHSSVAHSPRKDMAVDHGTFDLHAAVADPVGGSPQPA